MPHEVRSVIVSRELASGSVSLLGEKPAAAWVRWVLPSIADVFFLVLLGLLTYSPEVGPCSAMPTPVGTFETAKSFWPRDRCPMSIPSLTPERANRGMRGSGCTTRLSLQSTTSRGLNGVVFFTAGSLPGTFALLFHFVSTAKRKFCGSTLFDTIGRRRRADPHVGQATCSKLAFYPVCG